MRVAQITKEDWAVLSEKAHLVVFNEKKNAENDRIDFALVCENEHEIPMGYVTCRETDAHTLYWQYGGMFPDTKGSIKSLGVTKKFLEWCKERYKRVYFQVENTNAPMLKMAIACGFVIIGVRNYKGSILVEHILDLEM